MQKLAYRNYTCANVFFHDFISAQIKSNKFRYKYQFNNSGTFLMTKKLLSVTFWFRWQFQQLISALTDANKVELCRNISTKYDCFSEICKLVDFFLSCKTIKWRKQKYHAPALNIFNICCINFIKPIFRMELRFKNLEKCAGKIKAKKFGPHSFLPL